MTGNLKIIFQMYILDWYTRGYDLSGNMDKLGN